MSFVELLMTHLPKPIALVYRDDQLVVIDKPSGLLAVPGRGPDKQDCAATRLQAMHPEALVVHRLDRDTSGLMLFARDADTHRRLSKQFEERRVRKEYLAVVEGRVEADEGVIELPLRKCFERPPRHRVDHVHGKPAVTRWRVIERGEQTTRVQLFPETGRSHQLRIHMQQLQDAGGRHPILGDPLYGSQEERSQEETDTRSRLMLHATLLELKHPTTGEVVTWTLTCPF